MRQPQRAVKWTIFLGATAVVVYFCLRILRPFLDVIAWSSIFCIAFYPVHRELVRRTRRVSFSALVCSLLVVVATLLPLLLIAGLAINQFLALKDYLNQTFEDGFDLSAVEPLSRASDWLNRRLGLDATEMLDWARQHGSELGRLTAGYSLSLAANVTHLVLSSVFAVFTIFFLFRDGERIVARIPQLLPFERAQSEAMLLRVRDVIYASVYGLLVIAAIQGALCAFMFWLLGVPSAVLWGVVTALTSVLPLVGAAVVWIPGAVYLFATGQWPQALVLAAWGTVVISGIDNFLRPRLVGGRVGLNELVIFFAVLGGMQVFGVLGVVLGPVLFAVAGSILGVLSDEEG